MLTNKNHVIHNNPYMEVRGSVSENHMADCGGQFVTLGGAHVMPSSGEQYPSKDYLITSEYD